jgi:ferredoxin
MRIVVNRLLCEGNGVCAEKAPELLAMDDNDELQILRESFGEDLRAKAEAAVRICPKHALSLED